MSSPGTPANNTPAPAESSPSSALTDDGLSEMFSTPGTGSSPSSEGAPAQPPTEGQPVVQPAPTTQVPDPNAVQQPAPVAPPAPSPEVQAMRDLIDTMRQGQQPPQPGQQGQQPREPNPLTDVPQYQFALPPPVMQALDDPDPVKRGAALSAVISAVGRTIHSQVIAQVQLNLQHLMQNIPNTVQSVQSEQEMQKTVNNDFYGKYPMYNTPTLRPLVQMALVKVAQANPALAQAGWNEQLRDAVGAYLAKEVPLAVQQAQPAKQPVAQPPALMVQGSRPAAPSMDGNDAALAEMFS